MSNPVLYFDVAKILGFDPLDKIWAESLTRTWAESFKGNSVRIGTKEVGQVTGVIVDVRDGYARAGLIISWSNQLVEVTNANKGN